MKTQSLTLSKYAFGVTAAILPVCMLLNNLLGCFYSTYCLDPVAYGSPMCSGALALLTFAAGTYSYLSYVVVCTICLGVVGLLGSILVKS